MARNHFTSHSHRDRCRSSAPSTRTGYAGANISATSWRHAKKQSAGRTRAADPAAVLLPAAGRRCHRRRRGPARLALAAIREDRHPRPGPTPLTSPVLPAETGGMKRIVILGGGTGGTLHANRLRRAYRPQAADIVVVDRDDAHVYQPGLLFVPFGLAEARRLTRPRWRQLRSGITYCQDTIDHVDVENDRVYLGNGNTLDYDVLIVATGAQLLP